MFRFLKSGSFLSLILFIGLWTFYVFIAQAFHILPFSWELRYFLLGQKINEGFYLYQDIPENIAPIAAFVYATLNLFAVKISLLPFFASVLIGLQGLIFQRTVQRYDLVPNLGYLPFILFVSLFFISLELWSLSPALMGLTFILLAWSETIRQQRGLTANDRVFLIGIYLGLGSLFFFSYSFFILWGFYALIAFTGVNVRQLLLYLVGFFIPFLLNFSYLNYTENLSSLLEVFKTSAFQFKVIDTDNLPHILITFLPGILIALIGFYKLATSGKIRANAQKAQQTNFGWLVLCILLLFSLPNYSRYNLVIFIPGLSLLGLQIFYLFRKNIVKEILVWSLIGVCLLSQQIELKIDKKLLLPTGKLPIRNEKLLVLGPQLEEYLDNRMTGPFVNWGISKGLFTDLNQYEKVIILTNLFEKDTPNYIYDPENTFKNIQRRIPNIGLKYRELPNHLFVRNN